MALMEYVSLAIALILQNWFWFVLTWTIGLLAYILVPFLTGILPRINRRWIMEHHGNNAMQMLGRAIFVARETSSDHTLTPIKYDGSMGSGVEKFKLAGEERHATDELNVMGRLWGKTFGVLDERYGVITDLRYALIGEIEHDLQLDGLAEKDVTYQTRERVSTDGGTKNNEEDDEYQVVERTETAYCDRYPLPDTNPLVDIRSVGYIMHGSARPTDMNTSYDLTVKSQEEFWSNIGMREMIRFISAFGIPFILTAFLSDQFGDTSGSGLADSVTGIAGTITIDPTWIVHLL